MAVCLRRGHLSADLAAHSLIEGDATLAMKLYMAKKYFTAKKVFMAKKSFMAKITISDRNSKTTFTCLYTIDIQ